MNFINSIPIFGSIVNAVMIVFGSVAGLALRNWLPAKIIELPLQGMGLLVASLGLSMAITTRHVLIVIVAITAGSVIGELLDIEGRLGREAVRVEERFGGASGGFSAGFIAGTVLYCTGSMAVLGAFEEGLGGYPFLLLTKSLIDGLMSVALAASLGFGVMFVAVPIVLYQGALTLLASYLQPFLTEAALTEMTAAGGLMLTGIGLNMLSLTKIRSMNMIPGLVLAPVLAVIFL